MYLTRLTLIEIMNIANALKKCQLMGGFWDFLYKDKERSSITTASCPIPARVPGVMALKDSGSEESEFQLMRLKYRLLQLNTNIYFEWERNRKAELGQTCSFCFVILQS